METLHHLVVGHVARRATVEAAVDPLLTVKEAASVLGVSRVTFWRRVKDGTIPQAIAIGGLRRWPRSEILNVIERAKAQRGAAA